MCLIEERTSCVIVGLLFYIVTDCTITLVCELLNYRTIKGPANFKLSVTENRGVITNNVVQRDPS
jgi:hypothetical protein